MVFTRAPHWPFQLALLGLSLKLHAAFLHDRRRRAIASTSEQLLLATRSGSSARYIRDPRSGRGEYFCILGRVWRRAHNEKAQRCCVSRRDATSHARSAVIDLYRRTKERQGIQGPGKVRAWIRRRLGQGKGWREAKAGARQMNRVQGQGL